MYKDKIILVTGASKGIGKSIIEFFAKNEANIIMTYHINKELAELTKKEIEDTYHVKVSLYQLDLHSEEDIIKLYQDINREYEHLDILVNNASLSMDDDIDNLTKDEFMEV